MNRPIRILIVEDHRSMQESLRSMLALADDMTITGVASTGREGFIMACERRPDVVLMDVQLPSEDGIATSRAIFSVLPRTKIILMSGEVGPGFKWRQVLAQASAYLPKPFTVDELHNTIRTVTNNGHSAQIE